MRFVERVEVRAHGQDPVQSQLPGRQQHRPGRCCPAHPAGASLRGKERAGEGSGPAPRSGTPRQGERSGAGPRRAGQRPPSARQGPAQPGRGEAAGRAPPAAAGRAGESCPATVAAGAATAAPRLTRAAAGAAAAASGGAGRSCGPAAGERGRGEKRLRAKMSRSSTKHPLPPAPLRAGGHPPWRAGAGRSSPTLRALSRPLRTAALRRPRRASRPGAAAPPGCPESGRSCRPLGRRVPGGL